MNLENRVDFDKNHATGKFIIKAYRNGKLIRQVASKYSTLEYAESQAFYECNFRDLMRWVPSFNLWAMIG